MPLLAWTDGAERVAAPVAGTYIATVPWRLVLHSTEGDTVEGAVEAYRAPNSWPHATVDPRARRWVQHLPYDRPARALRHPGGTVETNNARALQLELVGRAGQSHTWAAADLDWLGRMLDPLLRAFDITPTAPPFYGEGAGWTLATATARQRMSPQAWLAFDGVCGHQHVPNNTHWDPGALHIGRVLAAVTEGDDMPTADEVAEAVWNHLLTNKWDKQFAAKDIVSSMDQATAQTRDMLTNVTTSRVPNSTWKGNLRDFVEEANKAAYQGQLQQAGLTAQIAALTTAVQALAKGQGADPAAIAAAAQAGAEAALAGFTLTLSKD